MVSDRCLGSVSRLEFAPSMTPAAGLAMFGSEICLSLGRRTCLPLPNSCQCQALLAGLRPSRPLSLSSLCSWPVTGEERRGIPPPPRWLRPSAQGGRPSCTRSNAAAPPTRRTIRSSRRSAGSDDSQQPHAEPDCSYLYTRRGSSHRLGPSPEGQVDDRSLLLGPRPLLD